MLPVGSHCRQAAGTLCRELGRGVSHAVVLVLAVRLLLGIEEIPNPGLDCLEVEEAEELELPKSTSVGRRR